MPVASKVQSQLRLQMCCRTRRKAKDSTTQLLPIQSVSCLKVAGGSNREVRIKSMMGLISRHAPPAAGHGQGQQADSKHPKADPLIGLTPRGAVPAAGRSQDPRADSRGQGGHRRGICAHQADRPAGQACLLPAKQAAAEATLPARAGCDKGAAAIGCACAAGPSTGSAYGALPRTKAEVAKASYQGQQSLSGKCMTFSSSRATLLCTAGARGQN